MEVTKVKRNTINKTHGVVLTSIGGILCATGFAILILAIHPNQYTTWDIIFWCISAMGACFLATGLTELIHPDAE
jgi:Trk-type K+ transport system membrane component